MFSGEGEAQRQTAFGSLSSNLFAEEYPQAAGYLTPQSDGPTLLQLDVCSFLGIGRFVLGLYEDIEVLGDDDFQKYLKERISKIKC